MKIRLGSVALVLLATSAALAQSNPFDMSNEKPAVVTPPPSPAPPAAEVVPSPTTDPAAAGAPSPATVPSPVATEPPMTAPAAAGEPPADAKGADAAISSARRYVVPFADLVFS